MKIDEGTVVEISYSVELDSGEVIQGGPGEPTRYSFVFGKGQVFPALERKLKGLEPNSTVKVVLTPVEGFGEIRQDLIKEAPLKDFPSNLEIKEGHMYRTVDQRGNPTYFSVKNIKDDVAVLDFNHPLAGENLHFDITVLSVRPAMPKELV